MTEKVLLGTQLHEMVDGHVLPLDMHNLSCAVIIVTGDLLA